MPLLLRHNLIGMPTVLVRRSAYDGGGTGVRRADGLLRLPDVAAARTPIPGRLPRGLGRGLPRADQQVTMTSRRRGQQQLTLLDQIDGTARRGAGREARPALHAQAAACRGPSSAALDELQDAGPPLGEPGTWASRRGPIPACGDRPRIGRGARRPRPRPGRGSRARAGCGTSSCAKACASTCGVDFDRRRRETSADLPGMLAVKVVILGGGYGTRSPRRAPCVRSRWSRSAACRSSGTS